MPYFWMLFKDAALNGTVEADTASTAHWVAELKQGAAPLTEERLPWPARPVLFQTGDCPPFCFQPSICAGRSSCPRNIACTE